MFPRALAEAGAVLAKTADESLQVQKLRKILFFFLSLFLSFMQRKRKKQSRVHAQVPPDPVPLIIMLRYTQRGPARRERRYRQPSRFRFSRVNSRNFPLKFNYDRFQLTKFTTRSRRTARERKREKGEKNETRNTLSR